MPKNDLSPEEHTSKIINTVVKYQIRSWIIHKVLTISILFICAQILSFFIRNPLNVDRSEIESREHFTPRFLRRD